MKNGITINVVYSDTVIIPTFDFNKKAKEKEYIFCNYLGEPIFKSTTGVKNEPKEVVDNKA